MTLTKLRYDHVLLSEFHFVRLCQLGPILAKGSRRVNTQLV